MIMKIMAKPLSVAPKALQVAIDVLVPVPSVILGSLVGPGHIAVGSPNSRMNVGAISFNHFSRRQLSEDTMLEHLQIRPGATPIRTIQVDNVAGLNASSNFIANARAIVLVSVPGLAERFGLWDDAIDSINTNLARPISIAKGTSPEPVLPSDLHTEHNTTGISSDSSDSHNKWNGGTYDLNPQSTDGNDIDF